VFRCKWQIDVRVKQQIAAIAESTAGLPNSVAWAEIVAKLQAAGRPPKQAHQLRERVWAARRVRKASISVQ
jgi:hypothetical protein